MRVQGNWNDPAHVRSKITQDLLKSAGGLAPRIEYARLSINGDFFGFYSIEESLKDDWASCFGMDMTAEVTDRGICQDVQPEEGQSVAAACAEAAGECVALPVAGAGQDLCRPPPMTPAVLRGLTRQHNPSKCRENGGFDQDCCAGAGQSSCADGFVHVPTGDACWADVAFTYLCVPSSAYPDCRTETPWELRDHCSWDGRCDSPVMNTEGDGLFCHSSRDACNGVCTNPAAGYSGTWCPGQPAPPPPPPGQCPPGCTFHAPPLRCDSAVLTQDAVEVGKSTILKQDHGPGGVWPAAPPQGGSSADGFERKEPGCDGCDNDFLMDNNPEDTPDCMCDAVPQIDALFSAIHSGDKATVAAAINMTSVFIYQAFAVLVNNGAPLQRNMGPFILKVVNAHR